MTETVSEPDTIIRRLRDILDNDPTLAGQLEASLRKAKAVAGEKLNPKLFKALQWPTDIDQYEAYLHEFIRWIPQESTTVSIDARLCHFYWLVDQWVGDDESVLVQLSESFQDWLTEFAKQWGSFLDTTESFNAVILQSFAERPEYELDDSMVNGAPNMPSGWLTFNQFFARQLNGGLRPIAEPDSNSVVTRPGDSQLLHVLDIDSDSSIPTTTLKGTHSYNNIKQLLEGSQYADSFAGGTFIHYLLTPFDYHRFHLPVGGVVKESFVTQGKVIQRIDLQGDKMDYKLNVEDSVFTGYQFWQTRGVVTIDTADSDAGNVGVVAVIPVGQWQVASVVLTASKGKHMAKGEEFGYFQFGGSEIIVLLQEGLDAQVDTDKSHRRFGELAARCQTLRS